MFLYKEKIISLIQYLSLQAYEPLLSERPSGRRGSFQKALTNYLILLRNNLRGNLSLKDKQKVILQIKAVMQNESDFECINRNKIESEKFNSNDVQHILNDLSNNHHDLWQAINISDPDNDDRHEDFIDELASIQRRTEELSLEINHQNMLANTQLQAALVAEQKSKNQEQEKNIYEAINAFQKSILHCQRIIALNENDLFPIPGQENFISTQQKFLKFLYQLFTSLVNANLFEKAEMVAPLIDDLISQLKMYYHDKPLNQAMVLSIETFVWQFKASMYAREHKAKASNLAYLESLACYQKIEPAYQVPKNLEKFYRNSARGSAIYGQCLYLEENYEEAILHYNKSNDLYMEMLQRNLTDEPHDDLYNQLMNNFYHQAHCFVKLNQLQEAIKCIEAAIEFCKKCTEHSLTLLSLYQELCQVFIYWHKDLLQKDQIIEARSILVRMDEIQNAVMHLLSPAQILINYINKFLSSTLPPPWQDRTQYKKPSEVKVINALKKFRDDMTEANAKAVLDIMNIFTVKYPSHNFVNDFNFIKTSMVECFRGITTGIDSSHTPPTI